MASRPALFSPCSGYRLSRTPALITKVVDEGLAQETLSNPVEPALSTFYLYNYLYLHLYLYLYLCLCLYIYINMLHVYSSCLRPAILILSSTRTVHHLRPVYQAPEHISILLNKSHSTTILTYLKDPSLSSCCSTIFGNLARNAADTLHGSHKPHRKPTSDYGSAKRVPNARIKPHRPLTTPNRTKA